MKILGLHESQANIKLIKMALYFCQLINLIALLTSSYVFIRYITYHCGVIYDAVNRNKSPVMFIN